MRAVAAWLVLENHFKLEISQNLVHTELFLSWSMLLRSKYVLWLNETLLDFIYAAGFERIACTAMFMWLSVNLGRGVLI